MIGKFLVLSTRFQGFGFTRFGCFNWDSTDLKHPKHQAELRTRIHKLRVAAITNVHILCWCWLLSKFKVQAICLEVFRTLWCTCDPHFGCMKPVGLRLSWWIQLSPQQMNPRCHERTCKVIHFAQTAKIFICTWKNLTKNSKVRNGQWSHAAICCSTCDYIPSFKGMPILNVGSISCPVPCHLDQGKAPGKLAKIHSHKDWSSRWCRIRNHLISTCIDER